MFLALKETVIGESESLLDRFNNARKQIAGYDQKNESTIGFIFCPAEYTTKTNPKTNQKTNPTPNKTKFLPYQRIPVMCEHIERKKSLDQLRFF